MLIFSGGKSAIKRAKRNAISAIEEAALRFNFLFLNNAEVALRTKVFKICCASISLSFQIFFRLKAQFYTLNLILPHLDRNVDKCRPCLANDLLFFSRISKKNAVFALCCEISIAEVRLRFSLVRKCGSAIAELRCASTESKSLLPKLRAALQNLKKSNCTICTALLQFEKIVAICCAALFV